MKKHICHISTTFNLRSGSARRTAAILRRAEVEGYKTSLIVGESNDVVDSCFRSTRIHVLPELSKYIQIVKDFGSIHRLNKILGKIGPDLVHTHLAKAGILGRLAAHHAKVPLILHTVHGPSFPKVLPFYRYWFYRQLERVCSRVTDMFIFVGEELMQEYVNAAVSSLSKSVVIRTGRDLSQIESLHSKTDSEVRALRRELCSLTSPERMIVNVGRLVPSKQQHHSISVLKKLWDRGIKTDLVIVGEAFLQEEREYEKFLRGYVRGLDLERRVHFAGYRNDILDVISAADALLLTSQYEGLPNVLVEAALVGTPFVTYETGGAEEILRLAGKGRIIGQGDVQGAAEAISRFIRNLSNGINVARRRHPQESIMENFSEEAMVERKMELYARMLG